MAWGADEAKRLHLIHCTDPDCKEYGHHKEVMPSGPVYPTNDDPPSEHTHTPECFEC